MTMKDLANDQSAYERDRDAIAARPCRCVDCPDCAGRGFVNGRRGWDGFEDDPETCDYCQGSGTCEQCERCEELDELEEAYAIHPQ
jgi:DnaJ-class molecular chaperone